MKKLMLLGGSRYLKPVLDAAKKLGIYTITADYLPDNYAHQYSDEYVNVSVIDKEKTLAVAQQLGIDGIMSFACDPGVVTAAYVAEQMGLPFQGPYQSVKILQDQGLFRQFLTENDFNVPHAKRYTDKIAPFADINFFKWPVIVKPVDSAGSKGVTKVDTPDKLTAAIEVAVEGSHNGAFIIEDFLTFEGYHSSADLFTVDGELKFVSYSDQLFDKDADNPYTPALIIWPSSMKKKYQDELTAETQRLMKLLKMKTGIYNIETCVGADGKPYIMEVSPRGGGCKIAELQRMAYGIDLIENEVRNAIGLSLTKIRQAECDGVWCEMVVHALPNQSGILKEIHVDSEIEGKYLRLKDVNAKPGDMVLPFTGANMSLGDMFFCCGSRKELDDVMTKTNEWLHIVLD